MRSCTRAARALGRVVSTVNRVLRFERVGDLAERLLPNRVAGAHARRIARTQSEEPFSGDARRRLFRGGERRIELASEVRDGVERESLLEGLHHGVREWRRPSKGATDAHVVRIAALQEKKLYGVDARVVADSLYRRVGEFGLVPRMAFVFEPRMAEVHPQRDGERRVTLGIREVPFAEIADLLAYRALPDNGRDLCIAETRAGVTSVDARVR